MLLDNDQFFQASNDQKYYAQLPVNSPMSSYGGSILQLTNPENEIQKISLMLRGKKIDFNGNEIEAGPALCNDEGVRAIVGLLESTMNQDAIMSDLEEKKIDAIVDFLGDTLVKVLMRKSRAYGIADDAVRDKIHYMVVVAALVTLHRANMGGERRFWKGSQQEITTRIEGSPKGKSFAQKLFGWGG